MSVDIGVDLGTTSVLVYIKERGIVLREPSVVSINKINNKIIAIGDEAYKMQDKTPSDIITINPLEAGVISNYKLTEKMLKYFIDKSVGKKTLRKPRICVCVPANSTEVEKKAVEDAVYQAGAREVCIIEQPLAAAIGSDIDILQPHGNMIVNIGGGTTDVSVLSLGGTVVSKSIRVAGSSFDEAIKRYIRSEYKFLIGKKTAENIKINLATVCPLEDDLNMDISGRNLYSGLPSTIVISANELVKPLSEVCDKIVELIFDVLEETTPELASDIAQTGIILTGGSCLLHGISDYIESKIRIPIMSVANPMNVVAIGTGLYMTINDALIQTYKKEV